MNSADLTTYVLFKEMVHKDRSIDEKLQSNHNFEFGLYRLLDLHFFRKLTEIINSLLNRIKFKLKTTNSRICMRINLGLYYSYIIFKFKNLNFYIKDSSI